MNDYTIVGLQNHNIMLAFDGRRVNFPLPIVDGRYPEGPALQKLLSAYVKNAREVQTRQAALVASNEVAIRALISASEADRRTAALRSRNQFLRLTDWTQARDVPLSEAAVAAWQDYRQALRDLPTQSGFPVSIAWPQPPQPVTNPAGLALTDALGAPVAG